MKVVISVILLLLGLGFYGCVSAPPTPQQSARSFLNSRGYDDQLVENVVKRRQLLHLQVLELSKSNSTDVRYLVAANPYLSHEEIDLFIGDSSDFVRSGVAFNPALSKEQIAILTKDRSLLVIDQLATNPAVSQAALLRLHREARPGLVSLAMNPNCPEEIKNEIRKSGDDLAKYWLRATEEKIRENQDFKKDW